MRVTALVFAAGTAFLACLLLLSAYLAHQVDLEFKKRAVQASERISNTDYWANNDGSVISMDSLSVLSTQDVERLTPPTTEKNAQYLRVWETDGSTAQAATALGSDLKHHFVQGYLSGFMPFDADELWIPHYTIALRKSYMYDKDQYSGYKDVWQNSIEAYSNTRGDCEDHSIILCDWLNALGYEARVATGLHGTSGHAWVVVYLNDEAFILEATQKSNLKNNHHYPLASILPDYKPSLMFDLDHFYLPANPNRINHDRESWVKSSFLERNVSL
ncbi:MAG: hypothetical protein JKX84_03630 [Flavobacteriales bacterium]|nr:hypothetical protein [Flavobacteriales bacterium]